MGLFHPEELDFAHRLGELIFVNPFAPDRFELEHRLLGSAYRADGVLWSRSGVDEKSRANIGKLHQLAEEWADRLRLRLDEPGSARATPDEWQQYWKIVMYHLFERYRGALAGLLVDEDATSFPRYREFRADFNYYLEKAGDAFHYYTAERTVAIFFQIHRAFHHIFEFLIGGTAAAGALRASVWQSIFSYDLERYNRALFDRMNNITTLITGESGTGKEVVARAIAFSQYIPFDAKTMRFVSSYRESFRPLHLSAMPATLIESELFGHRKGAFTGALEDRTGHLENCSEYGTVFLDEIGEITSETQVKLLRILQTRRFQRLGESRERQFTGKLLAATNRDLPEAIGEGRFREDLYYRLCADMIVTAPLREILDGRRAELENFIQLLCVRLIGEREAADFTAEAAGWIEKNLGNSYPWPGNVRELEQCLRNLLIRRNYQPARTTEGKQKSGGGWLAAAGRNELTADELLRHYCRQVYAECGNYLAASERLGLDRRTVKRYCAED